MAAYTLDLPLLFPFYFKLNAQLSITEVGPSLLKILPSLHHESFSETFTIEKAEHAASDFQYMLQCAAKREVIILSASNINLSFKGYFISSVQGDDVAFCGNPVINSIITLKKLNLNENDFAVYDTLPNTLQIIQYLEENINRINRKAENYLFESDLFHKIIDLVPQQIFLKDSQSRFLLVNKKMSELFGMDIKDIIGKTDRDFWDKSEEVEFYNDIDKQVIETGQRFEIAEEPQTRKDGKRCINHVVKMPFTMANGEKCVLGIAIDITDIKETQQAKFEIASGVLHDIGNGVVGFGSYLNRIKRQLEQDNVKNLENLTAFFTANTVAIASAIGEAKAHALIEMLNGITNTQKINQEEIRKSIVEQYNIISHIQEILNIQRQYVDGQETSRERKPIDLRAIINDCISMAFASVDKRHITLSLEIQPKMPIIKGDRTKLMQVILNIFKNSTESIDINSEEKKIIVRLYTLYDSIVIEVQDSGCGFDEETGRKLFERGYTTKPTGTGFGLHNCKQILESHSGSIEISSGGEGRGALVTIKLKII